MFIAGTRVSVDELELVFQSPAGEDELKLCCWDRNPLKTLPTCLACFLLLQEGCKA